MQNFFFENSESEFEETPSGEREEWMHLADLCQNDTNTDVSDSHASNDLEYWQSFRNNYT